MPDDEVAVLQETLLAHRHMLLGASRTNPELDLDTALEVHAGLGDIMAHWPDFGVDEQRQIVRTIEYLVNPEDERPDLRSSDGFGDDLVQLHRLRAYLGYV